jgi:hypothetical protein
MANENSTRNDGDVWACDFFVLFCFELFLKFRILRKENSRNYGFKINLIIIKKLFHKKKKKKKRVELGMVPKHPRWFAQGGSRDENSHSSKNVNDSKGLLC